MTKQDAADNDNNEQLESFIAFRDANWSGDLTELQLIISTHLYIENGLDEMLDKIFKYDNEITKLPFKHKLIVASGVGLDHEEIEMFKKINSLRNKFAHKLNYKINWNDISTLSKHSTYTKRDWDKDKTRVLSYILSAVLGLTTVAFEYGAKIKIEK